MLTVAGENLQSQALSHSLDMKLCNTKAVL